MALASSPSSVVTAGSFKSLGDVASRGGLMRGWHCAPAVQIRPTCPQREKRSTSLFPCPHGGSGRWQPCSHLPPSLHFLPEPAHPWCDGDRRGSQRHQEADAAIQRAWGPLPFCPCPVLPGMRAHRGEPRAVPQHPLAPPAALAVAGCRGHDCGQAGREQSWMMFLEHRAEMKPLQGQKRLNLTSLGKGAGLKMKSPGERCCWPENRNRWIE